MVNWHRKIWVIGSETDVGGDASDLLFKPGATNEIWLVPLATLGEGRMCFTVGYETGQVAVGWRRWVLFEEGDQSFNPGASIQSEDTKRLEGVGMVNGVTRVLKLYLQTLADGTEGLRAEIVLPGGGGDNGLAIGHPRVAGP